MPRMFTRTSANYLSSAIEPDVGTTWSFFAKISSCANAAIHYAIMGRRSTTGSTGGWTVARMGSTHLRLTFFGVANYDCVCAVLADGAAHTVAFTRNGTALIAYLDGAESGTATISASASPTAGSGRKLFVGAWSLNGTALETDSNYDGTIADLAMWNATLTPQNIAALHAGTSPLSIGTVANYWPLDTRLTDLSGNGATLTNSGSVVGFDAASGGGIIRTGMDGGLVTGT